MGSRFREFSFFCTEKVKGAGACSASMVAVWWRTSLPRPPRRVGISHNVRPRSAYVLRNRWKSSCTSCPAAPKRQNRGGCHRPESFAFHPRFCAGCPRSQPRSFSKRIHRGCSAGDGSPTCTERRHAGPPDDQPKTVKVVVRPGETLQQTALRALGQDDSQILKQIQELNPRMTNPDHIEADQEIRLPQISKASNPPPVAGANDLSRKT